MTNKKKTISVAFASYQGVMQLQGGPRTQILQTKLELERLGVRVEFFDAWKEFRRDEFDLVHIFSANVGTYALARNLHLNGIPFVVSPIFYSRRPSKTIKTVLALSNGARKLYRGLSTDLTMMQDICTWAKAVLPNTQAEASLFHDGFGIPSERLAVVPNGVEARFANADAKLFEQEFGIKNFLLNVGHIGPERKNVYRLLQAAQGINKPLVIIGRIEQSEAGKRCLALAAKNSRVKILDALPHDSPLLASAYAACDAFVLPSQFETPGIAALEAGLAGTRIVITPNGGTKEYFGNSATYVLYGSVDDIRNGTLLALQKPKRTGLPDRIRKEFLWERVAEKTLGVYSRL